MSFDLIEKNIAKINGLIKKSGRPCDKVWELYEPTSQLIFNHVVGKIEGDFREHYPFIGLYKPELTKIMYNVGILALPACTHMAVKYIPGIEPTVCFYRGNDFTEVEVSKIMKIILLKK